MQSSEAQMKATMPEKYAEILYHCKCVTILDLVMKFAFFFCFPMKETLIFGLVSSMPSAIALYGIFIEKEPINKSKWLLPAIIHHALVYIIFVGSIFLGHLYYLVNGKFEQNHYSHLPLDPIRQLLVIVMLSGTGVAIALFAFVQMGRMFLYKWSDLIMVVKEENGKSTDEKMMV